MLPLQHYRTRREYTPRHMLRYECPDVRMSDFLTVRTIVGWTRYRLIRCSHAKRPNAEVQTELISIV